MPISTLEIPETKGSMRAISWGVVRTVKVSGDGLNFVAPGSPEFRAESEGDIGSEKAEDDTARSRLLLAFDDCAPVREC